MLDRLSSLAVGLTLIVVAIILASLAGGDALTIAILAVAGGAAVMIVHAAAPQAPLALAETPRNPVPSPPQSLLRHPDFARWADQEREPLIGTDDNIVTIANDAAVRLLGQHIVGADIRTAIRHPAATGWLARGEVVPSATDISLIDFPRPGHHWTMRIATLSEKEGVIILTDRSAIDATDRMRSDFVANASHELRTPLAAILGFVETLQDIEGENDSESRQHFLRIIEREARRMQQLVIDLLSISRVEVDRFRRPTTSIDLAIVVRATLAQIRDSSDKRAVDIRFHMDDEAAPIMGDEVQLTQLVHNIVTNAMKYGRPGSPVSVDLSRANGRVKFSVRDEGEGIAPDHLPRLTERFYRVDEARSRSVGGTGLGLAIVKHIAERHQGQLDIESELGKGTLVSVTFPLV